MCVIDPLIRALLISIMNSAGVVPSMASAKLLRNEGFVKTRTGVRCLSKGSALRSAAVHSPEVRSAAVAGRIASRRHIRHSLMVCGLLPAASIASGENCRIVNSKRKTVGSNTIHGHFPRHAYSGSHQLGNDTLTEGRVWRRSSSSFCCCPLVNILYTFASSSALATMSCFRTRDCSAARARTFLTSQFPFSEFERAAYDGYFRVALGVVVPACDRLSLAPE